MDIGTRKADRIVNVGDASNFYSLYSTATNLLGGRCKDAVLALSFLEDGNCSAEDCEKAAEQMGAVVGVLAGHAPSDAVWDMNHPDVPAPWIGNLSSDVMSCADLYTTSEGEPLIQELTTLLRFAGATGQDVVVLG